MQKTATSVEALQRAIRLYQKWMQQVGYSLQTRGNYQCQLRHWTRFVADNNLPWEQIFTVGTLTAFKETLKVKSVSAVYGLSRYLYAQKQISAPIGKKRWHLPEPYAAYIEYRRGNHRVGRGYTGSIHRVLEGLHQWLDKRDIAIADITISHIDAFCAEFNAPLALVTRKLYRSCLRGFLSYLYRQTGLLKKDLASLLVGPAAYALEKPPKFLRPSQIKRLFEALEMQTLAGLRTGAMLYLAFTLGLRPCEICRIELDDIHFADKQLTLTTRKNNQPITLPIADQTLKAITAYVIGGRPDCGHRMLFANHLTPYGPVQANTVSRDIGALMRKAGLDASAYWLRHSYAQNLLESGASIYEIKEMMGHDTIQSSQRYLSIHTQLMRKVICDENV